MNSARLRTLRRITLVLVVLVGGLFLLHVWARHWVEGALRDQIRAAASSVQATWVAEERTAIQFDLFGGDLRIVDLRTEAVDAANSRATRASGRIDSLVVDGLGYMALLFKGRVSASRIVLFASDLNIALVSDTVARSDKNSVIHRTNLAQLQVDLRNIHLVTPDSLVVDLERMDLLGNGVKLDLRKPGLESRSLDLQVVQLRLSPMADSTLKADTMKVDVTRGTAAISGITFGPAAVVEHAKRLPIERDVVAGKVDRITIAGLKVDSLLNGHVQFRSLHLGTSNLTVARDKVLADVPFKHKPLPAKLLRSLPALTGVDSIIVDDLSVDYHERVDLARGFARIPFTRIEALVLNAHHQVADTMAIRATALVFENTPLSLDLRSHIGDTLDRVHVKASVGRLSFPQLNKVLQPLVGVSTPEGRLDTLILHMTGGDHQANARCWMRYDGLKVDRRTGRKTFDPILNSVMNAIVKKGRTGAKKDEGWVDYSWQRRRDRSLFNYLWAGVREGAKTSMLPKLVVEQLPKK